MNDFIEYFDNELCNYLADKAGDCDTSQKEIVVFVEHGQMADFIRNKLWRLCQMLEPELEIEYGFDDSGKIFAIIKRYKDHVCVIRVFVRIVNALSLMGLRPDVIVVYGSFRADQIREVFCFIQQHSNKNPELHFFNR